MKSNRASDKPTLLVTSAGRRNELLRLLHNVCEKENIQLIIADAQKEVSSRLYNLSFFLLPEVSSPSYFDRLIALCEEQNVRGLISLTDYENLRLSEHTELLMKSDIHWLGSMPHAIKIADNKKSFLTLCEEYDISHSSLYTAKSRDKNWIKKPIDGSRSVGVMEISRDEISASDQSSDSYVLVEHLTGEECTVDVLSDEKGIHLIVPRLRKQVRDGESVVGMTIRNRAIEHVIDQIYEALPGLRGIWNVQGFLKDGEFKVTELNPRISGGLPLSIQAGANFFEWFISRIDPNVIFEPGDWRENVTMYRYLQGVYEG